MKFECLIWVKRILDLVGASLESIHHVARKKKKQELILVWLIRSCGQTTISKTGFECGFKGQETTAALEEKLKSELSIIKERYNELEKELCLDKQLLEASRESHERLEKEVQFLKEERDSLDVAISRSTQRLRAVANDKENALKDLNVEVKRRKEMEEEIKQISFAFASRQKSLMSFHNEIKSKMQKLTTQNPKSQ